MVVFPGVLPVQYRRMARQQSLEAFGLAFYILKRLGLALITLIGVTIVAFALLQMLPGEPIDSLVPIDASQETRELITAQFGFDQPVVTQYFRWLGNIVRGDFGRSISQQTQVIVLVSGALKNTLILALGACLFGMVFSLLIGVYSAYQPNSPLSWMGTVVGIAGISIPNYCLSLILIGIFSVSLRMLPCTGMYTSGAANDFASLLRHLIMPAIAAGAMTLGIMTRMVRSSVEDVLHKDYIATLRAKGLPGGTILRHVLRNSLPTLLTVGGLQFGYLMGGSAMVETIFSWPGIGLLVYQSIVRNDFPIIQGAILLVAAIFVGINLIIDILHVVLDPRLRK